jgi:hypothetical protein
MNTLQHKPPPKTTPGKIPVRKAKTAQLDVDVQVEILADTKGAKIKGGETTFLPVGKLPGGNLYSTPSYSWIQKGGLKTVNKVSGPVLIKGTVRIQTAYSPKANPADRSAYGRGTTPEDERTGNTSLGFHESSHRSDYIKYLKTNAFPTFNGKVGMTEQQYKQAQASFVNSMSGYFKKMEEYSQRHTDEVGYKKSTFKAKGPRS